MDQCESSVARAVQAWRRATEVYAKVFESLAVATAAGSKEGQEAGCGQRQFEDMAKTARAALDASMTFTLPEQFRTSTPEETTGQDEDTDETSGDKDEGLENEKQAKRAGTAERCRQRRRRKLRERAARLANEAVRCATSQPSLVSDASTSQPSQDLKRSEVANVAYEDVSAEVEARLRAKDEQRAAARTEKKRKRQSADPFELMAVDGNAGPPSIKRARADHDDDNDARFEGGMQIRKKHARNGEENMEGSPHKRMKL